MSQRSAPRGSQPLQYDHETVEQLLFHYHYGRLSPEQNAAVEAHVRSCVWCREAGLKHVATERMYAMQQRPKTRRRRSRRPLNAALSLILVALLTMTGFIFYARVQRGMSHLTAGGNTPHGMLATPSPSPTATPQSLVQTAAVGPAGVVSIAYAPDGRRLALGTNGNGVMLYTNGVLTQHLAGFEGHPAPGALVWSADGKRLAAAGRASVVVWDTTTGTRLNTILIPPDPGTALSIFAVEKGSSAGSVPDTIFAQTGFAQWGANGVVVAALMPDDASAPLAPSGALIALWGSQEGTRIFRDAGGTTSIGASAADRAAHAAFMRWSPDDRYLLWGYPQLPISSALSDVNGGTPAMTPSPAGTPTPAAISAPNIAVARLVEHVGQAENTAASAVIWPSGDGTRLAVDDASGASPTLTILDAASGVSVGIFPALTIPVTAPLAMLSWQQTAPLSVAITTGQSAVTGYSVPK